MWTWLRNLLREPDLPTAPLPSLPPVDDVIAAVEDAHKARQETVKLRREQKRLADAYVASIMQAIAEKERGTV